MAGIADLHRTDSVCACRCYLDTGEVRKDRASGQTMFVIGVVAMRGRDSSVIQVQVPGEPKGLGVGTALRLVGLEGAPWERDGRSGVSLRAVAVTPLEMGGAVNAGRKLLAYP
jgi:hypothetical protein